MDPANTGRRPIIVRSPSACVLLHPATTNIVPKRNAHKFRPNKIAEEVKKSLTQAALSSLVLRAPAQPNFPMLPGYWYTGPNSNISTDPAIPLERLSYLYHPKTTT